MRSSFMRCRNTITFNRKRLGHNVVKLFLLYNMCTITSNNFANDKFLTDRLYADCERKYYEFLSQKDSKCPGLETHLSGKDEYEKHQISTINTEVSAPKANKNAKKHQKSKAIKAKAERAHNITAGINTRSEVKDRQWNNESNLVFEIKRAREHIKTSLEKMEGITSMTAPVSPEILNRMETMEKEQKDLKNIVFNLQEVVMDLQKRLNIFENSANHDEKKSISNTVEDKNDNDIDLFGSESEEENEEAARIRAERLKAYAAKKSKKPEIIAKSSLILDVKPWDDETNLKALESEIRKISTDGLLWGASKLVPVAFGIQKLSISCVVEDEKVSIDWLTEEIEKHEDYVQSVDIAAFNKI